MPPVNSPVEDGQRLAPTDLPSFATTRTPSPSSILPSLSHLNSSVPDLASTLTLHSSVDPVGEAEMENLSFLRHPSATEEPISNHRPSPASQLSRDTREANRRRREALQQRERSLSNEAQDQRRLRDRHLRQNFDSHEAWAESLRNRVTAPPPRSVHLSDSQHREPYAEGPPNQQALYDWAPATEDDEDELDEILAELRELQPNTHPDILRVLGRAQMEARMVALEERSRRNANSVPERNSGDGTGTGHQNSLRTAAILSSVRRNRQLSARSRDLMQRYVMDRERTDRERGGQEAGTDEPRDRNNSASNLWFRVAQQANEQHGNRYELNRLAWQAAQRPSGSSNLQSNPGVQGDSSQNPQVHRSAETLETLRRRYLEDPGTHGHQQDSLKSIESFKSTIEFIDCLATLVRDDADTDDMHRMLQQQRYARTNLPSIDLKTANVLSQGLPPPPSSFLKPGIVFSGYQQAAPQITAITTHQSNQSATDTGTNTTTLYRLPNGQGLATGAVDPAAAAAARAVWNGGRDGSRTTSTHLPYSSHPSGPSSSIQVSVGSRPRDATTNTSTPPGQDRWAVRVQIHEVNYNDMTMKGTMEAFNVPGGGQGLYPESAMRSTQRGNSSENTSTTQSDHPATGKTTTFSTYLTGELIDLSHHTLRTTNALYPAKAEVSDDAKYWKRLEPFASAVREGRRDRGDTDDGGIYEDAALAVRMLDPRWLEEEWREKYVLMRWKERCFVKPTNVAPAISRPTSASRGTRRSSEEGLRNISGEREIRSRDGTAAHTPSFGLSIKGFYYVSMRRSDGKIEGLYFDPHSSPYQRLEMDVDRKEVGLGGSVPAWEFA